MLDPCQCIAEFRNPIQLEIIMSANRFHILWRGQTSGPYSVEQIEQMLANRQVSLSHQVNVNGEMVFVEDFLENRKAEATQQKSAEDAKVAEAKAKNEHERQKELMELELAQASAAAPLPPVVGFPQAQGGPPVMAAPLPSAPAQDSGSGILGAILTLVIIAALGVGGWYAYKHFSGPTIKELEAMTMSRMTLNYIAKGHNFTVKSVTLKKRNKREYYGTCVVDTPKWGNVNADLEITVDGDKVTIVSIDIDD